MKKLALVLFAVIGLNAGVSAQKGAWSNPVLIYGSSFGSYFQVLQKQGRFTTMLKFTSSECIKKYGAEKILKTYEDMNFSYVIKLKNKEDNTNGTVTLNYDKPYVMTEKGILRMVVVVENDTVKFVSSNHFLK